MPVPAPVARRRLTLVAIVVVVGIFSAVVAGIAWRARGHLRDLILQREGEVMDSAAQLQLAAPSAQLTDFGAADPTPDLFNAVLETSFLKGVLAVQLYDATGAMRESSPAAAPETLDPATLAQMRLVQPVERFDAAANLGQVPGLPPAARDAGPAPLLEITVPLHRPDHPELLGAARYWIDGTVVAAEFRQLDRQLSLQAGVALGSGALLLIAVLAWAFGQLNRTDRDLRRRSEDLARANRELAFAAKTSALGAISAHLIHDLKNPLAGLAGFVGDEAAGNGGTGDDEAWQEAVHTTRRLRTMVTDIAALLRDEAEGAFLPLTSAEIGTAALRRAAATAARTEVRIVSEVSEGGPPVPGREGNLGILVLANLLDNACKASPRGAEVRLSAQAGNQRLEFLVTDSGMGLPEAVQKDLFQPKTATGKGGSGLGLAISQQLARHAGGLIELAHTGPKGTQFRFWLPL